MAAAARHVIYLRVALRPDDLDAADVHNALWVATRVFSIEALRLLSVRSVVVAAASGLDRVSSGL